MDLTQRYVDIVKALPLSDLCHDIKEFGIGQKDSCVYESLQNTITVELQSRE